MLFHVSKEVNYSIRVIGHNLFVRYEQYLMKGSCFELKKMPQQLSNNLIPERITLENVKDCRDSPYSMDRMEYYLKNCASLVDGFLFYTKNKMEPVGFLWVMYKGGNEDQYRVRNADAFVFYVYVKEHFRGNGVAGIMLEYLKIFLSQRGIDDFYLGVRKNNKPAIRAYEKNGMHIVAQKHFYRVFGLRFPYPVA